MAGFGANEIVYGALGAWAGTALAGPVGAKIGMEIGAVFAAASGAILGAGLADDVVSETSFDLE
ncbi:MAG: hypothetical protein ACK5NN_12110 [Sphingomonadaceae bacterium]